MQQISPVSNCLSSISRQRSPTFQNYKGQIKTFLILEGNYLATARNITEAKPETDNLLLFHIILNLNNPVLTHYAECISHYFEFK